MSDEYGGFADHPTSITEARANRAGDGAHLWTPRDALIACLRALDRGEIAPTEVAIVVAEKHDDGGTRFHYWQRCDSTLSLIGMFSTALHDAHTREASKFQD